MTSKSAPKPIFSTDSPRIRYGFNNGESRVATVADLVKQARRALDAGDFLEAHTLATLGLEQPCAEEVGEDLGHVLIIALLEMGWLDEAHELLGRFDWRPDTNVERSCRIGRLYRELALRRPDAAERSVLLGKAMDAYRTAFETSGSHYPGVNTAFLAVLLGDSHLASRVAKQVIASCKQLIDTARGAHDLWVWASLAEAHAVLGDEKAAREAYAGTRLLARGRVRDLISVRRRARLVAGATFKDEGAFDKELKLPSLVVFSGHMLRNPESGLGRLSSANLPELGRAIERSLNEFDAELGFASAACGADILFLEAMLARGSAVHIVLPWQKAQFIRTSVAFADNGAWIERFHAVLARATSVRILAQDGMPESAAAFAFSGRILVGLGLLMAQSLGLEVKPLVVWDGERGGPGGTADFVSVWRSLNKEVTIIGSPSQPHSSAGVSLSRITLEGPLHHEVKTLLFADVVGYSRLTEAEVVTFVATVLKDISQLIAGSRHAPVFVNTWGDGLFMVFDSVQHGGQFAFELQDRFKQYSASNLGLPPDLTLRIALHCGPVLVGPDPIVRAIAFNGSHVSRAARIEPVVAPGNIFVSEEFAAAAMIDAPNEFDLESLGNVTLAKGAGLFRLFSLKPANRGKSDASVVG